MQWQRWSGSVLRPRRWQSKRTRFGTQPAPSTSWGNSTDVVRRASPKAWSTLRGPARIAIEERIAGEMLHRVAEEASPTPPLPPGPFDPNLAHQWLGDRYKTLDGALSDLRLSRTPPSSWPLKERPR